MTALRAVLLVVALALVAALSASAADVASAQLPAVPGQQQEQPSDPEPQPEPPAQQQECDPELEDCGEPCSPDVDDSCAPDCDEIDCGEGVEGDEGAPLPPSADPGGPDGGGIGGRAENVGAVQNVAGLTRVDSATVQRELPATGSEPLIVALAGLALLLGGLAVHVRLSRAHGRRAAPR